MDRHHNFLPSDAKNAYPLPQEMISFPPSSRDGAMSRKLRLDALLLIIALFFFGPGVPAWAQEEVFPTQEAIEEARSAPLFAAHELLHLTIEADFDALRRQDRSQESEERPAILRWSEPEGSEGSLEIQIRTRGNFRLMRRNCEFPPLRLNIRTGEAEGTLFHGQDKLKVVSPCRLGQSYWEQYVLREYLAYRTFNLLTEASYRVRLARVTYVDTSGKDDPFTRYAYIIEDEDAMAARSGRRVVELPEGRQVHPGTLEPHHAVLADVFQYLIGNTDWSGVAMHNMTFVQGPGGADSATIPYDFDFSGVVDARYAAPDSTLPITRVTQRHFRGFCPSEIGRAMETYDSVFALFRERKEAIYGLWTAQEGLEAGTVREVTRFFDDFYRTLEDPRRIESQMMRNCRSIGRD